MLQSQRLAIRASEIRQRLNELAAAEELTAEQTAECEELRGELSQNETQYRAALAGEGETQETRPAEGGSAEEREREQLRGRFSVARVIAARLNGRDPDGSEAEYVAARGGGAGQIPLDVWNRPAAASAEARAVTPGASTVGVDQRPITPAIFDRTIAAYLGVEMPAAGVGDQAYPVLSTSVTAGVAGKGATAPETAGAFTVGTAQPRRVTGAFRFQVEDAARLIGMEDALRRNLQDVLADKVDDRLLNGGAAAGGEDGKIRGLLALLDDPNAPAANAETWARYNVALTEAIDGLYAVDAAGVRALVGPHTYRHMSQAFRANESNESFAAYWQRTGGGVRASRRIGDPANNIQQAVIRRANPAGDAVAVMPHWDMMTIRDVYGGASDGEVIVTAYALVGDVVLLRPGCFVQDSFRLA